MHSRMKVFELEKYHVPLKRYSKFYSSLSIFMEIIVDYVFLKKKTIYYRVIISKVYRYEITCRYT